MTPTQARAWATYATRRAPWLLVCRATGHDWWTHPQCPAMILCSRCHRSRAVVR